MLGYLAENTKPVEQVRGELMQVGLVLLVILSVSSTKSGISSSSVSALSFERAVFPYIPFIVTSQRHTGHFECFDNHLRNSTGLNT